MQSRSSRSSGSSTSSSSRGARPGRALALGAASVACLSCLAALAWPSTAHAIVGGTADTTQPAVLVLLEDGSSFRCTATLIAPNLVVTARHCVGNNTGSTALCKVGGSDDGAQSLPVYAGNVAASPMFVAAAPGSPLLARGKTIHDDGATTTCGHDLALIELDRAVTGITPARVRRTPVAASATLTVMGFGWLDKEATVNATQRMKGTTTVRALGPVVHGFKPFGDTGSATQLVVVAAGEIAIDGLTKTGDSGGPAFDAAGDVAAVVARGYADPSYGPGTLTTLAAHLATIDAALAASGNAPPPADAGADAAPTLPTRDASSSEPTDPPPVAPPENDGGTLAASSDGSSDGGCAVRPGSSSPGRAALALAGLALALPLLRRRTRR